MSFGSMEETDTEPNGRGRLAWKSSPETLRSAWCPVSAASRTELSLSFSSRVRMASVPSLPGNFSYATAQFITLGKSSPPYPAPQKTPWGVTVSDQTRGSGLCQPFCLSFHLVMNLRRTGPPSLCVPHAGQAYTKSSSGIY